MTDDNDFHAPDDATYWEDLAQRIHGAALREAALSTGQRPQSVNDETGWLAARFPLASCVALAAAAAALFVTGWVRPVPSQRDVESAWAAAFLPLSLDRTGVGEGAPSIAALVIDGETLGPVPERPTTGGIP